MVFVVIFAAILPALVMVWLIYRKDKLQPEPVSQLLKGVLWGIASAFISFVFSVPLSLIFGEGTGVGFIDSAFTAFALAAVPEELAKFICLYLFLRKNKYFDEYMDGIVYAVCIGMGFAGFENIGYLFGTDEWVGLSIVRAIISIPGHYAFAVLMGYYFSHWRMLKDQKSMWLMLVTPILAHGIFDFLLMWAPYVECLYTILTIAFFYFLNKMHKHCSGLIAQQREFDKYQMMAHNNSESEHENNFNPNV